MFEINLQCRQGDFVLDAQLALEAGRFHVLLGPSGAGKSTLLRLIAGLERNVTGSIRLPDGESWLTESCCKPARERSVGLMFQHHALFPHLSVEQNIRFGLGRDARDERVQMLLEAIGLTRRRHCRPSGLSGGECQRVALARAIAPMPQMLLLDEPFSSLDEKTAGEVQRLVRQLQRQEGFTVLMVTHNRSEAYRLADRVWLLDRGKVTDAGEPERILLGRRISGRFQMQAEVCALESDGLMTRVELLAQEHRFFVLVDEHTIRQRRIVTGSKVILAAKASEFSLFPFYPGDDGDRQQGITEGECK